MASKEATVCNVGTVREVTARLKKEGFQISEYALRLWIKDGTLPAVYSGKRALISYKKVLEIINAAT